MSFSMFPHVPTSGRPKPYIKIKAGKCDLELQSGSENSYNVSPNMKKGQLSLVKGSNGVTHYQWSDRITETVIDDFMVFPGDAILSKVNTGKETDRVYLLKWQGAGVRKIMFWMQEKSSADDEENCRKFNEYITSPPPAENAAAAGPGGDQGADLMRLLGRAPGAASATGATNSASAPPPANIGGFDFSQLLSGAMTQPSRPPAASGTPGAALSATDFQSAMMGGNSGSGAPQQPPTDLSEVLRPDQVVGTGIISNPDVVADLIPHLPEGQQTAEHLEQAIRSAQFQQATSELGSAVEQDPSGAVISNVGLTPPTGGVNFNDPVGSFLDAVQSSAPAEETTTTATTTTTTAVMSTPVRPPESKDGDDAAGDNSKMDESA